MKYRIFTYCALADEECAELNAFLASHRIANVDHFPANGGNSVIFVVEYVERGADGGTRQGAPKTDYRERLSDAQFAVFSQLRDLRKKIAEEEGVPVYTVFTNAQLAEIVERAITSESGLGSVAGVGKARVEKYGTRFLELCSDLLGGENTYFPEKGRLSCGASETSLSGLLAARTC